MRAGRLSLTTLLAIAVTLVVLVAAVTPGQARGAAAVSLFSTSDRCLACHNGLVTNRGQDVSIGSDWRASVMANSARDPYWQAAVRRETIDHATAAEAIQDECSKCHMPMARTEARAAGHVGTIFAHLPLNQAATRPALLAADGVSCAVCHQIQPDGLGTPLSFTGGFVIDTQRQWGTRSVFGPFRVDAGRSRIMQSASRMRPFKGEHLQRSEVCATCHTLITHALDARGNVVGELPEQVPYLEWRHSSYRTSRSCQSCHMPVAEDAVAISSVLGQLRPAFSRHVFRGGNAFLLRAFGAYQAELGVGALPQELTSAEQRTLQHLRSSAATLSVGARSSAAGRLDVVVRVTNLAGHKLPTAYPSRRVWIHLVVRDSAGGIVFESGALDGRGGIVGNANDRDPRRFEPHYDRVERVDQVQIYEPILAAPDGTVTTGLLTASQYAKDNRLLPRGFDPATASREIAVHGRVKTDSTFRAGGDTVHYSIDVAPTNGTLQVQVQLLYQSIGYRWARNLSGLSSAEPRRFARIYARLSGGSAVVLAEQSAEVDMREAPP